VPAPCPPRPPPSAASNPPHRRRGLRQGGVRRAASWLPQSKLIIAEPPPEPRNNAGFSAFPPVLPPVFVFGSGSAGARCLATRRFVNQQDRCAFIEAGLGNRRGLSREATCDQECRVALRPSRRV